MSEDGSSVGLVEEILEQQSAQALKLSHIDEAVADLKLNLQRLADVTALATSATTAPQQVIKSGPDHSHAIDSLEKDIHATKSRLGLVLGLMGVQTLILVALVIFALKPMAQAPVSSAPVAQPAAVEAPKPQTPPPSEAAPAAIVDPFKGASGTPDKDEDKPAEKAEKSGKKKKKK